MTKGRTQWVFVGRDIHGDKMFAQREVGRSVSVEPPTIDELAPPGLEGVPLTIEKPVTPGGREREWQPFIVHSLPRGDRD